MFQFRVRLLHVSKVNSKWNLLLGLAIPGGYANLSYPVALAGNELKWIVNSQPTKLAFLLFRSLIRIKP